MTLYIFSDNNQSHHLVSEAADNCCSLNVLKIDHLICDKLSPGVEKRMCGWKRSHHSHRTFPLTDDKEYDVLSVSIARTQGARLGSRVSNDPHSRRLLML